MKMRRTVIGMMAWVMLFWTGPCFGWGDSLDEIRVAATSIQSLEATFRQEKHMRMLVQPLISEGHLAYQAPGSLRWEYVRPIENILLMHAGQTRRFVKTDTGWSKDAAATLQGMQVVMEQITQWFAGRFDTNPLFAVALDPGVKIVLTPKDATMAGMITRVELLLSATPGIMEKVIIYENDDSYTKLIFINAVANGPIAPSVFQQIQ